MLNIPTAISQAATAGMTKTRVPSSVSIAQWAIESGWGAHSPGNNPFGMKPRKGMNDPYQMLWTDENINKKDVRIKQPFRKFDTIDDAFIAHAMLLSTAPVYAPAMACLPAHGCPTPAAVDAFIDKMAPKYATDPLYASKLKAAIEAHDLRIYDIG